MSERRQNRIELIDAVRGLCVVLMVIHHALYNVHYFLDAPRWIFSNPVFDILHYIFAGLFIALSGVSSRFSRSNVKRGIKALILAGCITLVTWLLNVPIIFGVLHLLGFSMLFFGLTHRMWDKIPQNAAGVIYIVLIVASALARAYITPGTEYLWIFGWPGSGFVSYDYFPLFPWIFVFLLGTWAGVYIEQGDLPRWFYKQRSIPFFPTLGRRALLIYILHQPILYGIVMAVAHVL